MRSFYVSSQRLVVGLSRSTSTIRNNKPIICSFSSSPQSASPTALIFDTETTSKADFKLPPSHATQPDLVQLGMILVDTSDWTTKAQFSMLVNLREGVAIDAGAEKVHGISKEQCNTFGVHPDSAADIFHDMYQQSDVIVAHNLQFDSIVMEAALERCSRKKNKLAKLMGENDDGKQRICTMHESTELVKLSGKYGKDYKWPTLSEAYSFVTNEELEGGHDALVDATACKSIFRYLVEENIIRLNKVVARDYENVTIEEGNEMEDIGTTDSLESKGVVKLEDTIVHIIDFGKHKGQRWSDLPNGYKHWILANGIWRERANLWEYLYNAGLVQEQPTIESTDESSSVSNSDEEGCRLFIGNLSLDTSWQDLKDYFNEVGDVQFSDVAVEPDGRKNGFGFIRFATAAEASDAIEKLNGIEFMGSNIEVRHYKKKR